MSSKNRSHNDRKPKNQEGSIKGKKPDCTARMDRSSFLVQSQPVELKRWILSCREQHEVGKKSPKKRKSHGGTASARKQRKGHPKDDDNEEQDVWERRDFTTSDAHPSATWCVKARQASGGSSGQGSSLSSILQRQRREAFQSSSGQSG